MMARRSNADESPLHWTRSKDSVDAIADTTQCTLNCIQGVGAEVKITRVQFIAHWDDLFMLKGVRSGQFVGTHGKFRLSAIAYVLEFRHPRETMYFCNSWTLNGQLAICLADIEGHRQCTDVECWTGSISFSRISLTEANIRRSDTKSTGANPLWSFDNILQVLVRVSEARKEVPITCIMDQSDCFGWDVSGLV
jgi:hypothetical protein